MRGEYAFSQRRACGLMTMAVSRYRYQSRRCDEPLRTRLVELAREKPRFGYRRLHVLLSRSGDPVHHPVQVLAEGLITAPQLAQRPHPMFSVIDRAQHARAQ